VEDLGCKSEAAGEDWLQQEMGIVAAGGALVSGHLLNHSRGYQCIPDQISASTGGTGQV